MNDLPAKGKISARVSNTATYLHEGLNGFAATPATTEATTDNANTIDLRDEFPTLRAGDLLHFQRIGLSVKTSQSDRNTINPVVCVLSRTEEIDAGSVRHRVPGAIDAGTDFYTPRIDSGSAPFPTSTNIREDFIVGASTFIPLPDGAKFAMLSLASPGLESSPLSVEISHIEKDDFLDWIKSFGLNGELAESASDLDGDGLTLIEEYAFDRNPTVADSGINTDYAFAPRLSPQWEPGDPLALVFGARITGPIRYHAEFSTDLNNWLPGTEQNLNTISIAPFTGMGVFFVSDEETGPAKFGRIGIEYVPRPTN